MIGGNADAGRIDVGLDVSCTQPQSRCGNTCVDFASDNDNCGGCNTRCARTEVCAMGRCVTQCPMGLGLCDGR